MDDAKWPVVLEVKRPDLQSDLGVVGLGVRPCMRCDVIRLDKKEAVMKYDIEKGQIWRRSFDLLLPRP